MMTMEGLMEVKVERPAQGHPAGSWEVGLEPGSTRLTAHAPPLPFTRPPHPTWRLCLRLARAGGGSKPFSPAGGWGLRRAQCPPRCQGLFAWSPQKVTKFKVGQGASSFPCCGLWGAGGRPRSGLGARTI